VSDKVGVILSEMGEQEDSYAHALDDSRGTLKTIRNTEKSVQPSRDGRNKIADEIAKLKAKEPESTKLVVLEQELVRAEAENLVAEAQLTNVVSLPLRWVLYKVFVLTVKCRPGKSSRRHTKLSLSPPLSARISRSSSPAMAYDSCSYWTTLPWCRVIPCPGTRMRRRRGRF